MIYDFAVIGNGIIGSLLSCELSNLKIKTCLIGPENRSGSATIAAGAMQNVFGEVDFWEKNTEYQKQKILLGIQSIESWKYFSKNYFEEETIKTADDTLVYLSNKATNLEKKCFNLIKEISNKYLGEKLSRSQTSKLEFIKNSRVNDYAKEIFLIKNEGAIDTVKIFNLINKKLNKNGYIKNLNEKAISISKVKGVFKINTNNKNVIRANKLIVCNGAFLNDLKLKTLPVFYGVGSAIEIDNQFKNFSFMPKRTVIRTPNRGSTCGIHIVPRHDNIFYVGAGSYISKKPSFGHRVGTINYLLNSLETEFTGKLPHTTMNLVQGFRPISIDGKPLIGRLHNERDIFIASGTKRDGFTYAPVLVEHIIDSFVYEKKIPTHKDLFCNWEPDRKLISYLNRENAIKAYVDNKIAGLIEHGSVKSKYHENLIIDELKSEANIFHDKIQKKLRVDPNFGIHPELLNVL